MSAFYLSNVEQYLRQDGIWDEFCANVGDAAARRDQHVHPLRPPSGGGAPGFGLASELGNMQRDVAELPALRIPMPVLLLLFVGSGCAALIYEIVWFQLLQLVIGSSAVSMGVLLGTFMGGMCLGSLLLPRVGLGRGIIRCGSTPRSSSASASSACWCCSACRSSAASTPPGPAPAPSACSIRGVVAGRAACCRRRC